MELLTRINCYLARTGMSPTRFGRLAVNDSRFVEDVRRGREPRAATRARVLALIGEPEDEA